LDEVSLTSYVENTRRRFPMARFFKSRNEIQGKVPGEMIFVGRQKMEKTTIRMIQYNEEFIEDKEYSSVQDAADALRKDAFHDTKAIAPVETLFNIHPLTLEDVVNTGQRPKVEEFEDYISVMVKMMRLEPTDGKIHSEQLSILWGARFLITLQERKGDVFEPVRERLEGKRGRIRRSGPDYLAYALLDTIVDNYLILIERLGEEIEANEPLVIDDTGPQVLAQINEHRRELHFLRSSIRPAKDAFRELSRLETDLITSSTFIFIRDLNDLSTQAVEAMDTYRDMIKDQIESHSASNGNKLNDVMKFLTVFSVIFIPLSLLAGIYGTNFDHIPELHLRYGYYFFWGALVVVAAGMVFLFKRKKWL
jgi:magnesium transporter